MCCYVSRVTGKIWQTKSSAFSMTLHWVRASAATARGSQENKWIIALGPRKFYGRLAAIVR